MLLRFTRVKQADDCIQCVIRFCASIILSFISLQAFSQCGNSVQQSIPDPGVTTINLLVSGLVNSDLADPLQGICGVELDFMHEYLGDLTISLISPSGTRVELIGPVTTATTPTNLSRWNVSFVPCASTPSPDPGFTPVWSNLQAWQIFTNYSGVYHPNTGCLENFSSGSANGTWQIIVEDHNGLQAGIISRVNLIFCDPDGLVCSDCEPNAGTISPGLINLCVGDNISSGDVSIDFGGNPPSAAFYSYSFLMTSGNTIIRNGSSFSENPLPGVYEICGLSYLTSDTAAINALLSAGDYSALSQAITDGAICAQITSPCLTVNVASLADTVVVQEHLCNGETFTYRGQSYTGAGTFFQQVDGPGACDSVFRIEITKSDLQVAIDPPGVLSCGSSNLMLTSQVTGNSGTVLYQWSTNLGNIVGSNTTSSITIDQPGQYLLTITDMGCISSTSVTVMADNNFPQIFVSGGTITCNNPGVNLYPVYFPSNSSILWTGPFGFTTNIDSITVSVPGTYLIRATNALGCTSVRSVDVKIDTATHPVDIIELSRDCPAGTATIGIVDYSNVILWQWSGPNGFTSILQRPEISEPGQYVLINTFLNGCTRTGSFVFDGDFSIPDISGPLSDTLNCNEIIPLTISSSVAGVNYSWVGPNGFTSSAPTINVTTPGIYLGTVYAPNTCFAEHPVTIHQGNDVFEFTIFTDTITCKDDTVSIGVIASVADEFLWTNHSGSDNMLSSIMVGSAGIYTVMMTDTNSDCTISTDILVTADLARPGFLYKSDTITCTEGQATLTFTPFPGYIYEEIFWVLPDQTVIQGPAITSGDLGVHQLHGVSPNGCESVLNILIPVDTFPPVFFLEPEILGCDRQAEITTVSFEPLTQISWSGPGGFTSSSFNPMVPDTGIYVATATGTNGCVASIEVHVEGDLTPPDLSVESDTLDCLSPDAALTAHSFDAIEYEWIDADGMILANDSTVFVENPGMYIIYAIGSNQCAAIDTVFVNERDYPTVSILADTFICGLDTMLISAVTTEPDPEYVWLSPAGDTIGNQPDLVVQDSGPYVISITALNGCEGRDTLMIPVNQVTPTAVIEMIGELRCQNRDFVLDGSASMPANVNFEWIAVGGMLHSDPNAPTVNVSDTGLFILIVENPVNHCTNIASIKVEEHPDAIVEAFVEITPQACSGDSNAILNITGLTGGVPDFLYQLNGTVPQTGTTFSGLAAGEYLLEIMDAEGCVYDTNIVIEATLPFMVDAGPDIEIHIGESVDLNGISDIVPDAISSQTWDSAGVVLCQDCPTSSAGPLATTTYTFTITSETGCVLADEMVVYVIEKGRFYLPNAFSPNGDGINDEIRLHTGPGVARVLQWIIFDRWGDAVYGHTNFIPNDPAVFWDGTTLGNQTLNPAVFPYLLEIELINGNIETHHGSITLIR